RALNSKKTLQKLRKTALVSSVKQSTGIRVAGSWETVFAGSDAGQCHQLPPAKGWPGGRKFFRDGAIVFFRVQGPILTDGIFQEQIENGARWMAELTIAVDE